MNAPTDFGEWALLTVCLAAALYIVTDILTLTWRRAANLKKAILYRLRMGVWCDHTDSWTEWIETFHNPAIERRWCKACGWDRVRNHRTHRASG